MQPIELRLAMLARLALLGKIGMLFRYIASTATGKIIEDSIDADSLAQVLVFLNEKGLKPISVKPVGVAGIFANLRFSRKKISDSDKIFLTKYLGLMLKVGTGLIQAIDILINDIQKPALKSILIEIKANLQKGNPFFITFAKYPNTFPPIFSNLIRAGENSGRLEKTFEDLSASLEKEMELKSRIKSAMIYPVLLLSTSFVMFVALITFAVPKITGVFLSSNIEPPFFTKAVMALSKFSISFGPFILIAAAIAAAGLMIFYRKSKTGEIFFKRMVFRIPAIKTVIFKRSIQRLCINLSDLLSSGLPLIEALELTADTVGHPEIQSALRRIARERISQGLTIGESFKKEPIFPQVLVNLISVSEKAGHTADLLKTLGNFYVSEIDSAIKTLVSLLEPALLFLIAIIVGGIALAVIVPIYQMIGQF